MYSLKIWCWWLVKKCGHNHRSSLKFARAFPCVKLYLTRLFDAHEVIFSFSVSLVIFFNQIMQRNDVLWTSPFIFCCLFVFFFMNKGSYKDNSISLWWERLCYNEYSYKPLFVRDTLITTLKPCRYFFFFTSCRIK